MKQSPIRKLRRDRSRLEQEFQLARGTGDKEGAAKYEHQIKTLDKEIAALEKLRDAGG
jgi:hypothetical protein